MKYFLHKSLVFNWNCTFAFVQPIHKVIKVLMTFNLKCFAPFCFSFFDGSDLVLGQDASGSGLHAAADGVTVSGLCELRIL